MLSINHTLIGTSAGKLIGNSPIAFLLGIILHFIFDKVPHFWPQKFRDKKIMLGIDTLIAIVIIILSFQYSKSAGWGALGGESVDALLIFIKPLRLSKIGHWHSERQPHKTNPLFLFTDIIVIVLTLAYLIK